MDFRFGSFGFLWALAVSSTIAVLLNMWHVNKVIAWPVRRQIMIVYQYAIYSFVAAIPVYWIKTLLPDNLWLLLFAGTIIFAIVYMLLNRVFSTNAIVYLQEYFVQYKNRKKNRLSE